MLVANRDVRTVMIANRGAVAARIIRAVKQLGLRAVAVYSEADASAPYLSEADAAYPLGASAPRESYLNQDKLIVAAGASGADAIHPGYGFLSENADFARRIEAEGLLFIGPSPKWIETMGEKTRARDLMGSKGIPIGAGSGWLRAENNSAIEAAQRIGYPVLVKPAAGGGGIGMLPAYNETSLIQAVERSRSMAQRSFGNAEIYLERLIEEPRHIEIQVLADRYGNVRHFHERDCSVQRRHQKVVEESPAPGISRAVIDELGERICSVLGEIGYDNIGTVELLMAKDGSFNFLEMNTRLQVEHAVTEMVTGFDLVAAQIRAARGDRLSDIVPPSIPLRGHAIEARVCAEDPRTFFPSPGTLVRFRLPEPHPGLRIETGYVEGMNVTPFYDSLIAKIIVHATTRPHAISALGDALKNCDIHGVKTNIPFLLRMLDDPRFAAGDVHTGLATTLRS
jgi:acetyl-CoA carboxylase, biotin carboxylase subunit